MPGSRCITVTASSAATVLDSGRGRLAGTCRLPIPAGPVRSPCPSYFIKSVGAAHCAGDHWGMLNYGTEATLKNHSDQHKPARRPGTFSSSNSGGRLCPRGSRGAGLAGLCPRAHGVRARLPHCASQALRLSQAQGKTLGLQTDGRSLPRHLRRPAPEPAASPMTTV